MGPLIKVCQLNWTDDRNITTAPAQSAVKYQTARFNATLVIDSPYNGPPSEEVDRAWGDLLDSK